MQNCVWQSKFVIAWFVLACQSAFTVLYTRSSTATLVDMMRSPLMFISLKYHALHVIYTRLSHRMFCVTLKWTACLTLLRWWSVVSAAPHSAPTVWAQRSGSPRTSEELRWCREAGALKTWKICYRKIFHPCAAGKHLQTHLK